MHAEIIAMPPGGKKPHMRIAVRIHANVPTLISPLPLAGWLRQ
jgi:hypothetical protein